MVYSNENLYKEIVEIRDRTIYKLQLLLMLTICFACIAVAVISATSYNTNKQLDGLTKQLTRTQKQLKKVSEESADKTARIAELTGNGG